MKFAAEQLTGLVISSSHDDQTGEMLPVGVKPQSPTAVGTAVGDHALMHLQLPVFVSRLLLILG